MMLQEVDGLVWVYGSCEPEAEKEASTCSMERLRLPKKEKSIMVPWQAVYLAPVFAPPSASLGHLHTRKLGLPQQSSCRDTIFQYTVVLG